MQADGGLVDHAAHVGTDEVEDGLVALDLLFVPGDQHSLAKGGDDLHGGDARPRRDTRHGLDRQGGETRQLEDALHPVIVVHDGIVGIHMPAPGQVNLCAAIDDLPVGVIGALLLAGDGGQRVTVEGQGQAGGMGELEQAGQQPGIAPGRQDQVRVLAFQGGAQVDQQGAGGFERLAVTVAVMGNDDPLRRSMGRVAVRFEHQDAQGRRIGIKVPGGVQRRDGADAAALLSLFHIQADISQGKGTKGGGIMQRQGNIRVVKGEGGEGLGGGVEQAGLEGRRLHFDGQDRGGTGKQVTPLGAGEMERFRPGGQPLPEQAQFRGRAGSVKSEREGLDQAMAAAVPSQQPEADPLFPGIQVQQPAGELSHAAGSNRPPAGEGA